MTPQMKSKTTALGFDIGGTNLRIAVIDAEGKILSHHVEPVTKGREEFCKRLQVLVQEWRTPSTRAIGVGIPGRVDARSGRVISAGYLDLSNLPLAEILGSASALPVAVENDCTMALIAECAVGAANGKNNAVMFTIGTGIGGAIVMDGQPAYGHATAGQLGHITVQPNGVRCNCGRLGCVETTSSGTALNRHIREANLSPDTDVAKLLDAAKAGVSGAIELLSKWATPLRYATTSMSAAIDPDIVLIGGGLGWAMVRALALLPAENSWYQYELVAAELGDNAGVIGSGLRALVKFGKATI